jgi:hypothetical protein
MASRYDDPGVIPPKIELAVVGIVDGQDMRLSLNVNGKLQRFTLSPHVAAALIAELAQGLAVAPADHP